MKWHQWLGQLVCYGLLIAFVGYFSNLPTYENLEPGMASVKLSLRHTGQLLGECVKRTQEELNQLPANMRVANACPRERSPLLLEFFINDEAVLSEELEARGLHSDGMAATYHRFRVPAGTVNLRVQMKDHIEQKTFPYTAEKQVILAPAQSMVVDFDSNDLRFIFM